MTKVALLLAAVSLFCLRSVMADAEILCPKELRTAQELFQIEMAKDAPTSTALVEQNLHSDKETLRVGALRVVAIHRLADLYSRHSEWLAQQPGATRDITRILGPVFVSPETQDQPLIFSINPQELDIFARTSATPIVLPRDNERVEHVLPALFLRDLQNEKWDPVKRQQGEDRVKSFQEYRYIGPDLSRIP